MSSVLRVFPLVCVLVLAGCGSPSEVMTPVPVAGGHHIGIRVGPNGPLPGKGDGFTVLHAATAPGAEKHIVYQFALSAPPGAALQRIQVDDISDEQSGPLVDDQHPWVTENVWHIETSPIAADDPRLAWIYTVTPSLRVYRFTITDQAGHQTIIHHVTAYANYIKGIIRSQWGEKY